MVKVFQYYGQAQSLGGRLVGLPFWARLIMTIAALPGIVLLLLSLLAFGVSLLALLLLTVPVYRLLRALTGSSLQNSPSSETVSESAVTYEPVEGEVVSSEPAAVRRPIEVKIIE